MSRGSHVYNSLSLKPQNEGQGSHVYKSRAKAVGDDMSSLKRKVGLGETLSNERGMPGVGVYIWRPDRTEKHCVQTSVGEFLSRPENQSGIWLIDGGWGGPPGTIHVQWNGTDWDMWSWLSNRVSQED